jgi:hypothetical protein
VGIAAIGIGVAVKSGGFAAGAAGVEWPGERLGVSVFGTIHPKMLAMPYPVGTGITRRPAVRLASLDMRVGAAVAEEESPATMDGTSFADRFGSSFDGWSGGAAGPRVPAIAILPNPASAIASPARPRAHRVPVADPARQRAAALAAAPRKPVRTANAGNDLTPPADDSRTAIYDISARTVYLPNGEKLEAHSGLGSNLDDPGSVRLKGRGPTPPNVYQLTLRERPFHGVRAIRLTPVGDGEMYGRDGILAHSYMLGPNGQSNGCVSMSNYPAFLNAFMRGEIDRLVVVDQLATAPASRTGLGWLLPEPLRKLLM